VYILKSKIKKLSLQNIKSEYHNLFNSGLVFCKDNFIKIIFISLLLKRKTANTD
jgi:hypothetical protein